MPIQVGLGDCQVLVAGPADLPTSFPRNFIILGMGHRVEKFGVDGSMVDQVLVHVFEGARGEVGAVGASRDKA